MRDRSAEECLGFFDRQRIGGNAEAQERFATAHKRLNLLTKGNHGQALPFCIGVGGRTAKARLQQMHEGAA